MATDPKKWASWFRSQSARCNKNHILQKHLRQQHASQQAGGCRCTPTAKHDRRDHWRHETFNYPHYPRHQSWVWNSQQKRNVNTEKKAKTRFHTTVPVHNKISRTQTAATPSAIRIRARTRLTRTENKTHKGQASKVETTTAQLENDVYEALEVMDTDTGKLLNYRQLMRNPTYKKNWITS